MIFGKLFTAVILSMCLVSASSSQIFEVNSDARWIALGQVTDGYDGFNAIQQFLTSSSSKFADLTYASRPVNWLPWSDLRYWHTSISASLDSIQWARISYQRFDYGEFAITSVDPTVLATEKPYEAVLSLSYGRAISDNILVNVSYKYYYQSAITMSASEVSSGSSTAHVGDLVIGYHWPIHQSDHLTSSISLLGGLTNYGTWIVDENDRSIPISRYVRFGVLLTNNLVSEGGAGILSTVLSVNYRGLLNMPIRDDRDFWSFGTEIRLAEVLSLRGGFHILPYTSIYGNKAQGAATYGAGFNLPIDWIFPAASGLKIGFDYAAIPLNMGGYAWLTGQGTALHNKVYSASILYNWSQGEIF